MGDYNSCEHSELRKCVQSEFSKGYNEGYAKAIKIMREKENDNDNE